MRGSSLADEIHRSCLLSEGPEGGERWALRLGDLDQSFFSKFVQSPARQENAFPRNASNGLIKQCRNFFEKQLRERIAGRAMPLDYLRQLQRDLSRSVVFIGIQVQNDRDAMEVFERINVRGKPLSDADLVRHRLMSTATSKPERADVRKRWDQLESCLGEEAKTERFLRDVWIARTGDSKPARLYEAISIHLAAGESVVAFADECVEDAYAYSELLKADSQKLHHESRESVRATLSTLAVKTALPLLLSGFRRFGKDSKFSQLARAVEAVAVRHRFLAGLPDTDLRDALYKAAHEVRIARSRDSAMESAMSLLRAVDPSDSEVASGVRRTMKLTKHAATYILRQLETLFTYPDDSFRAKATLEHIFPVRAEVDQWPNRELLHPYLWHLGNLTLLTSRDNSKASNRKWTYKKNKVYLGASLKLTEAIADYPKWGKEPLLRRAGVLAQLALRRWSLKSVRTA